MITKLDIQEKDGFLTMEDFHMHCIFNKVKLGCGATTIALTNNENYIITVPTTELIENKCYPTKDAVGCPQRGHCQVSGSFSKGSSPS